MNRFVLAASLCALAACHAPSSSRSRTVPASADRASAAWRQFSDPSDAGFEVAALDTARRFADSVRSAAVMVVHRANVIAAWGAVDRKLRAHSIRKSLAGALYGIAAERGIVDLDATLATYGVDDLQRLSDAEKSATLRDLISARSGVFHPSAYADAGQLASFPARGSQPHGTYWAYNNWDFNVAEWILEQRAGRSIYDLYEEWLARPLGMEDYAPGDGFEVYEPSNSRFTAHTLAISARDLARVGQLYLRAGRWDGQQLVPARWITESTRPVSATGDGTGFGYLWWTYARGALAQYPTLNQHDIVLSRGSGGHAMILVPALDLMVVHRADTDNSVTVPGPAIWRLAEMIASAKRGEARGNGRLVPLSPTPLASQRAERVWPAALQLDAQLIAGITGTYAIAPGATLRVFAERERLFANATGPGGGEVELFAAGRDDFFARADPSITMRFVRDSSGRASEVIANVGRQQFRARRQ